MKKLCLVVAVLMVAAAPALADVDITCTYDIDSNTVTVNYSVSEPNKVRAFALDITVDSPAAINTIDYNDPNYWVYPGSIVIASGAVTDYGSPDANSIDFPMGTLPGLDSNGVTIEMGSLYSPTGDNETNAPGWSGTLLKFTVCHVFDGCKVKITENAIRGGIVLTNPNVVPTTNLPYTYTISLCVNVPDVVGQTEAAACSAITAVDSLVCAKAYNWDAGVAKGNVISQNPSGGECVDPGSTVTITVSRGPTPVNCMPPEGTGYNTQRTQFNLYVTNKWDPTQWCAYNATTNPKGGYHCHGDADGAKSTPDNYRIFTGDLNLIGANWKKKMGVYPAGADPRADIDHKASSPDNYRVFTGDLNRLTIAMNWKRKDTPCTACVPPAVCGLPKNCPLTDTANNTYVKPTSCP